MFADLSIRCFDMELLFAMFKSVINKKILKNDFLFHIG